MHQSPFGGAQEELEKILIVNRGCGEVAVPRLEVHWRFHSTSTMDAGSSHAYTSAYAHHTRVNTYTALPLSEVCEHDQANTAPSNVPNPRHEVGANSHTPPKTVRRIRRNAGSGASRTSIEIVRRSEAHLLRTIRRIPRSSLFAPRNHCVWGTLNKKLPTTLAQEMARVFSRKFVKVFTVRRTGIEPATTSV